MKKFFLGIGIGVGTEVIFGLGIYSLVSSFSSAYVDSSPFFVEYPAIICVLISIYLFLTKKSYKIVLGIFAGLLLAIVLWSVLLAGA
jgi:hypothetical protein